MRSDERTETDLLIIGAGPTGLTAAIDAVRHGLSVRIIDRGPRRTPWSKALVLHSRSMEIFEDLGCIDRILAAGREFRALNLLDGGRAIGRVEFRALDWGGAPWPMWFTIPQSETERCLEELLFDGEGGADPSAAWREAAETAFAKAGAAVRVVRIHRPTGSIPANGDRRAEDPIPLADEDGALHRAWGARRPLVFWVRPDKHVGFAGTSGAPLAAYLDAMFGAKGARS